MADQFRFLGGSSGGFLPISTGQIIGYIRSAGKFKVQRYIQNVQAPAPVFAYAYIDPDQPVRIFNRAEFVWEDGAERPTGNWNLTAYQWLTGRTQRLDIPWMLGDQAIETTRKNSKWDPAQVEQMQVASQMMTLRTSDVISACETASSWGANTADANVVNGGFGNWTQASDDPASPFYLAIRRTFTNIVKIITLGTNATVRCSDIRCVISPGAATMMANTAEIYNYVKYGPYSEPRQQGEDVDVDEEFGLPKKYAGIEIIVEDSPQVISRPTSTGTLATITSGNRAFVKSDTSAIFMSRPGGIDAPYGSKNFSTVQLYFYKYEMSAYQFHDPRNEREEGHLAEQRCVVIAAPASGFFCTSIM